MWKWLKREHKYPILYKRTEKIEWTRGDADAWAAVLDSPVYKKVEAFMHDRIINSLLSGGDKTFLKGVLYAISSLEGFKGEPEKNDKINPKELSPIQFFDD